MCIVFHKQSKSIGKTKIDEVFLPKLYNSVLAIIMSQKLNPTINNIGCKWEFDDKKAEKVFNTTNCKALCCMNSHIKV